MDDLTPPVAPDRKLTHCSRRLGFLLTETTIVTTQHSACGPGEGKQWCTIACPRLVHRQSVGS